jgi:hypothetical protein
MKHYLIRLYKKYPFVLLSYICFLLGLLCIPVSASMMLLYFPKQEMLSDIQNLAIFVGIWASTLISIANFLKNR